MNFRKSKRYLAFLTILSMLMVLMPSVYSESKVSEDTATLSGTINIMFDGQEFNPLEEDGSEIFPIVYKGRTFLPLRAILERIGANITWDGATSSILMEGKRNPNANFKNGQSRRKTPDKNIIVSINKGIKMKFDAQDFIPKEDDGSTVNPLIYKGRTYLPIRFVIQRFGGTVGWDAKLSMVILNLDTIAQLGQEEINDKLIILQNNGINEYLLKGSNIPLLREGKLSSESSSSPEIILQDYFKSNNSIYKFVQSNEVASTNFQNFFELISSRVNLDGSKVIRSQQMYNGLPVYGMDQVVQIDPKGVITSISGMIAPDLALKKGLNRAENITETQAEITALNDLYRTSADSAKGQTRKVILANEDYAVVAYMVNISYSTPEPGDWNYFIDASNGKIIDKLNNNVFATTLSSTTLNSTTLNKTTLNSNLRIIPTATPTPTPVTISAAKVIDSSVKILTPTSTPTPVPTSVVSRESTGINLTTRYPLLNIATPTPTPIPDNSPSDFYAPSERDLEIMKSFNIDASMLYKINRFALTNDKYVLNKDLWEKFFLANATGVLGDKKNINTTYISIPLPTGELNYYMLRDATRGTGVYTHDKTDTSIWVDFDNQYHETYDRPAVDAHFYAGITYDFYKNKFGRLSYNNSDSRVDTIVHVGTNYNNAYWSLSQNKMYFGDGDGTRWRPLSGSLDVVAHEFTHGVSNSEAGLIYANESGAISEALSDIFGTLTEFYFKPSTANWTVGEDVFTPGVAGDSLRSLADPVSTGNPDHLDNKYTGTGDYGGVHTNCGIINKAAYLISEGGTHHDVTVTGIGKEKMGNIMYKVMTDYLYSSSDFMHFAVSAKDAAKVLYGAGSPEYKAVSNAFVAVGILKAWKIPYVYKWPLTKIYIPE